MSVRSEIADGFAEYFHNVNLDDSYGVNVGKGDNNKCYEVTFCKARVLDGLVKVYGPKFIVVKWMTAYRDMDHKGMEKFVSFNDAIDFIKTNFVR